MALAAVGRFAEAAEWQERLVSEAERGGAPGTVIERLQVNLDRYRQGLPCGTR